MNWLVVAIFWLALKVLPRLFRSGPGPVETPADLTASSVARLEGEVPAHYVVSRLWSAGPELYEGYDIVRVDGRGDLVPSPPWSAVVLDGRVLSVALDGVFDLDPAGRVDQRLAWSDGGLDRLALLPGPVDVEPHQVEQLAVARPPRESAEAVRYTVPRDVRDDRPAPPAEAPVPTGLVVLGGIVAPFLVVGFVVDRRSRARRRIAT